MVDSATRMLIFKYKAFTFGFKLTTASVATDLSGAPNSNLCNVVAPKTVEAGIHCNYLLHENVWCFRSNDVQSMFGT